MKILCKLLVPLLLPQLVLGQFSFNPANIGNGAGAFDYVRFAFQYDVPSGAAVNQNNLESLLCRTQDFFTEDFRNSIGDPTLVFETVSIEWDPPRDGLPANVSFTALVTANGTDVPDKKDIIDAADQANMETYLNEYIIAVGCEEDGFAQVTGANFKASPVPPQAGDFNLTTASCQHTCAPTVSPGVPTGKLANYAERVIATTTCIYLILTLCVLFLSCY